TAPPACCWERLRIKKRLRNFDSEAFLMLDKTEVHAPGFLGNAACYAQPHFPLIRAGHDSLRRDKGATGRKGPAAGYRKRGGNIRQGGWIRPKKRQGPAPAQ